MGEITGKKLCKVLFFWKKDILLLVKFVENLLCVNGHRILSHMESPIPYYP